MTMLPLFSGQRWKDFFVEEPPNLYYTVEFPAASSNGSIEMETLELVQGFIKAEYKDDWWCLTVRQNDWKDLGELKRSIEGLRLLGEI